MSNNGSDSSQPTNSRMCVQTLGLCEWCMIAYLRQNWTVAELGSGLLLGTAQLCTGA